jgi:integrase
MNYSFKLKEPKKNKETLILFTSSFKNESKTFVYSTGEKINPNDWDFKNKRPNNLSGRKNDAEIRRSIDAQLSRYSNLFKQLVAQRKLVGEILTTEKLKEEFDIEFKKTKSISNNFFDVYNRFISEKKNDRTDQANSLTTIKRYEYNKTLLENFQTDTGFNLVFHNINKKFYNSFIHYCVEEKKHSANTLSRNIGLFKTFMFWAVNNKFTYNDEFKKFINIKRFATDEIALTLEEIENIYKYDLKNNHKLIRVRDLFVFGCATGMRYSNYSDVRKKDIIDGFIKVIDKKSNSKPLSIPLNKYSEEILEKYEYQLPQISNQKFNEYVKDLFKLMGYDETIKKTMKYGNEIVETESPLYERISSHTARRSFITIMKNKNVPDKVIMSYTGHKSLEVFNNYYRPNEDHRIKFMNDVFK